MEIFLKLTLHMKSFAIKIMHPGSSEECRRIAREVNILRDGHHPDIVKLKQVLDVPSYPYICIVMPLYPGTLHDVIVDHAHRE